MDNPILNNDELSEVEGVEGILDINRRKQIELGKIEDARAKAQKDFDFYARDAGGEPLDMGRVEEYKSKVEPWRFEQSLYGLQEDHFNSSTPEQVNANRRFTPILDNYLLDNPEAYQNLDKHTNREEHIARTLREDSHHYPMFSGEKQGEFTDLKTSEYERLAVANYFSETSEVGFDSVMKNMDLLASSYAQANGLETPDVSSVFNHIKGNLSQRKTERENDKSNWQNGISSVLNGKSLNEALAGSVDDKNGRVTSASRSAFMNEYGGELSKATELYERFSQEAGRTESAQSKLKFDIMPMKMMGGVVSAFTDVPKHQKDAVEQLAIMPREQRQRTLASSMCDRQWTMRRKVVEDGGDEAAFVLHDHGRALLESVERDVTLAYVHYNSGLHIRENGDAVAALLEEQSEGFDEIVLLAHSMGGLVSRSAIAAAEREGLRWRKRLSTLVTLGTPHHGSHLERAGHIADQLLAGTRWTAPLAPLAKIRSAGVTDLRHGAIVDVHDDRFAAGAELPTPVPLPTDVRTVAIAGTRSQRPEGKRPEGKGPEGEDVEFEALAAKLADDNLVPVRSALGLHDDDERTLAFNERHVVYATGHLPLLSSPEVFALIKQAVG